MLKVIHFEIQADDLERASKFYRNVFGWKIEKWKGPVDYLLVETGPEEEPGIGGGLMKRLKPGESTINSIEVPSLEEYVKKVTENGGKQIVPKEPVPGVGYIAYCKDTEGNTFSVFEFDKKAE